MLQEKKLSDLKIISDRNYDFFTDFGLEVLPYNEKDEIRFLQCFNPDFVFTGTSYTSKIELKFIEQAVKQNILSIAFIDHWTNFYSRFVWNEKVIFPDKIWVIDEKAKNLAIQDNLAPEKLQVAGNPYYEFLKIWEPTISRDEFLNFVALPEDASYILYVPEPLSQVGGVEKFGFDEYEVLEELISYFKKKYVYSHKFLLVKPHPNHQVEGFKKLLQSQPSNIKLLKSQTPINLLMHYADLVIGHFSNALMEGKLLGVKVVRLLPEKCKVEFMENDLIIVNKICNLI
ncbi:MAG: hypothetical protein NZ516_11705 [Raineya sp.]|nr:hypothetical protein [Raineya sp.]